MTRTVSTIVRNVPLLVALALGACSSEPKSSTDTDGGGDKCKPDDADGVVGGDVTFQLAIDDTAFTPTILKAQNKSTVTLTVKNNGTKAHGFSIACLPTPNADGCPTQSCFPDTSTIATIAPGETATAKFAVPVAEGLYDFKSAIAGDTQTGQFIVQ